MISPAVGGRGRITTSAVDLFVPCLTDTFLPRAAAATVLLLEHFGCEVSVPREQTCCGQAHFNAGATAEARSLVERMARIFSGERPVITPSGSCAAMVIEHAPTISASPAVLSLAKRTREVTQFLVEDLALAPATLGARWPGAPLRATVHYPCHGRALELAPLTDRILAAIEGVEVVPSPAADRCCGFGGAFAVDEAAISGAMGREKVASVASTGAELLVCNDSGCALQITGVAEHASPSADPPRVWHVAEVLAVSLGLELPSFGGESV